MRSWITARKARFAFALLLALLITAAIPFGAAYAAEAQAKKDWAFRNQGDFYYEDNIGSNLGAIGIVRAVEGVDIHIAPLREEPVAYERTVTVAMLDTGVNVQHPALADAIWTNEGEVPDDGIDNDGNGFIDDVHGWNFYNDSAVLFNARSYSEDAHGTHCAGILCANNPDEIVGVAGGVSAVKIMPIKVVGGNDSSGSLNDFIQGIRYAEANGADICSMSLGTRKDNDELYRTIRDSEMLFVVPACNGESAFGTGFNLDDYRRFPACWDLPNVIVVSNLQCDGTLHYTSNYSNKFVDIAAPGTQIYSTSANKAGYDFMTGTSMAVPMVAGTLALVHAYRTENTRLETKSAVLTNAKRYENLEASVKDGKVLDVYASVTAMGGKNDQQEPETPDDPSEPETPENPPEPTPPERPIHIICRWLRQLWQWIVHLFSKIRINSQGGLSEMNDHTVFCMNGGYTR